MSVTMLTAEASARDFRLEDYFRGKTTAEGQFTAINGVRRAFHVDLHGRWNGKVLTLVEDFTYADGERDRKTWRFRKTGPGLYRGTREDVIGETEVRIVETPRASPTTSISTVRRRRTGCISATRWS